MADRFIRMLDWIYDRFEGERAQAATGVAGEIMGNGWIRALLGALVIGVLLVVAFWLLRPVAVERDEPRYRPPPDAMQPYNDAARAATLQALAGAPGISGATWDEGALVLPVRGNSQDWEPVADSACTLARSRGMRGTMQVVVIDAAAMRNKRWKQLARVNCG